MRASHRWAAVALALGLTVVGCSSGSDSPTVASVATTSSTTVAQAGGPTSTEQSPLAQAQAYSTCMRKHGVPNFPDPVVTPSGGYGYRTTGIDGESASFQDALEACKDLPSPWSETDEELTPAQQEAWLRWADCIRDHGVPDFADPTFSGQEVRIADGGQAASSQLRSAMDACTSRVPAVGGLGG